MCGDASDKDYVEDYDKDLLPRFEPGPDFL
jgi:hypothetical protein